MENNILALRIKHLRTSLGLTQEELAIKLGLKGKSSIANYESGKITPSDDVKLKMCETFNCSMDYLMGLITYKNPKEELERRLYEFDLTENEYNDAINCFMSDSRKIQSLAFLLAFSPNFEDVEINKEKKVLTTILEYVLEFIPDDLKMPNIANITNKEKREQVEKEFYQNFDKALRLAKKMLLSLDKNKIIHNRTSNNYFMCPVYGKISAGVPNWAEECLEGYLPIDPNLMGIVNPEETFFLLVNGESMNKVIRNGAYALIRKQDIVEDGEIAAVLVNRI